MPELDPAAIARIYTDGFTADDLVSVPDDHLLVAPIKPLRQTVSGLWTSSGAQELPGTAALMYRVVRVGQSFVTGYVDCGPADVVVLRNAMLDPLTSKMDLLLIHRQHITSKLNIPMAPPAVEDNEPAPFRGAVAVNPTPAMLLSPTVGVYDG